MTAYLLSDTPRLGRFVGQFIPNDRKPEANEIFNRLTRVVGGYLRGQLITSVAISIFTFVLLEVIGVPNSLAFAVLAGFADVVPLVGAVIATIPPAAAALQESSTKALAVLIGMIAYQQFEDRVLIPRVYGRTLNLPAIIVLIAVLAGAELLGIIGVLLALPLTAAARVAVDYLIESRQIVLPSQPREAVESAEPASSSEQPFAPDMPEPDTGADRREEGRQDTPRRRQQSPPETSPGA
jgi:predicted PurR-regulated permease PerM